MQIMYDKLKNAVAHNLRQQHSYHSPFFFFITPLFKIPQRGILNNQRFNEARDINHRLLSWFAPAICRGGGHLAPSYKL